MKWTWTRQYTIGEQIPGVPATTIHSLELPTDPLAFDPTLAKQGAIAAPSHPIRTFKQPNVFSKMRLWHLQSFSLLSELKTNLASQHIPIQHICPDAKLPSASLIFHISEHI